MTKAGETTIKFIEMLLTESASLLIRLGISRTDVETLTRDFVLNLSQKVAGTNNLYFKKNLKIEAQLKRNDIRAEFWAGSTVFQLCEKWNLSTAQIYNSTFALGKNM